MAVDVEELILAPFREVVARGSEALKNAEAGAEDDGERSAQMAKAAKAVVREGERALKRLQPLWDSQVEKHGDMFKEAMSKNETIETKLRKLEDLLYDFEDFTEVATFQEERYSGLQAAVKALALYLLDAIKRLKIERVPMVLGSLHQPSTFPPLPPLPAHIRLAGPPPQTPKLRAVQKTPSTSMLSIDVESARVSSQIFGDSLLEMLQSTDTTEITETTETTDGVSANSSPTSLRRRVVSEPVSPIKEVPTKESRVAVVNEPTNPARTTRKTPSERTSRVKEFRLFPVPRTTEWVKDQVASVDGSRAKTRGPPPLSLKGWAKGEPSRDRESPRASGDSPIPENETVNNVTATSDENAYEVTSFDHVPSASVLSKLTRCSVEGSLLKTVVSVSPATNVDTTDRPGGPPPPPPPHTANSGRRLSSGSSLFSSSLSQALTSASQTTVGTASTPVTVPESSNALSTTPTKGSTARLAIKPPSECADSVMWSEDWKSIVSDELMSSPSTRGLHELDCRIGPKSSLFRMNGFCEGAVKYRNKGLSHAIRKTSGYVAHHSTDIGRCVGCGYAHHFDELALDVNKDAKANFSNSGIRFRIRFLYKSHLTTHKMAEAYYGCLFCAHAGVTVSEGDATVFQSSDALFRHLARHPWPLPEVPGLTTLYGQDLSMDDPRLQDFDVHFVLAPPPGVSQSGIPDAVLPEIGKRPMAVAIKPHVQRFGEKKLQRPPGYVDKDLLQFFAGARLVGVEFPVVWAGKWATAWHDGRLGVLAAKYVELELPRRHEAPPLHLASGQHSRTRSSSGRAMPATPSPTVTARWKFEPHDAAAKGWLAFDKGDVIHDVDWVYRDHWCWSGINAKGKRGMFPRSHVHHEAVQGRRDEKAESPSAQASLPPTSPRKTASFRGLPRVLRRKGSMSPGFGGSVSASGIADIISR